MNNHEHKGGSFSSLIFGMIIGAGLVWFFTKTKEGEKTAKQIKEKSEDIIENLTTIVEDIERKGKEFKKRVGDVETEIKQRFDQAKGELVDNISEEKLSKIEELQERGRKAAKKFFTKNGKSLA